MANKGFICQYAILLALVTMILPAVRAEPITFSLFATDMSGCDPNSDCDLVVTIMCSDGRTENWVKCGETSKMQNNNNPVWPEVFTLDHTPGTDQRWRFEMVDIDFQFDDFIAAIDVVVDDYAARAGNLFQIRVPDNTGTFWIHRSR